MLLVIAAGAVGVAVGSRFAHPLAGALAAFALLVPFSQSNRFNDPFIWLFPWVAPGQLRELPGPLAGYPPAAAHAAMLAGLAVLAALVALVLTVGRRGSASGWRWPRRRPSRSSAWPGPRSCGRFPCPS